MTSDTVILEAKDCCSFLNQEGHGEAIQYFISKKNSLTIFNFGKKSNKEEEEIAYFNYRDAKWYAGRFIGEALFEFNNTKYKIIINPRFGNNQLFRMLEEVYNIRLPHSKNNFEKQNQYQYLIKKLIAFLWLNLLSKANKHGIPKNNTIRFYKGTSIIGKLDIRKSILPLFTEEKVISKYHEKTPDKTITNILKSAYRILKTEYSLTNDMISMSSKNAIEQLYSSKIAENHVTENDYNKIQYRDIYLTYKPIVDLSWDILKKRNFGNNRDKNKDGLSFFIDMAEIWEMYLKSILKKKFLKDGWIIRNDKITTYKEKDFRRTLIPDIILEKGDDVMVWDAKYKRMEFDYFDYDRSDFFQIHTYISYFKENRNVIAGGLLYPLSKEFSNIRQEKNKANSLYSEEKNKINFIVDGIDYSQINEENIVTEESKFLDRISSII
jgi:5-methylcytosine-specific restriction enzyme subunit McrC